MIKFLRDHNIGSNLLNKAELVTFIKVINSDFSMYEDDALDYQGFVQLIIQSAIHFHLKNKFIQPQETGDKLVSQLTFGDMVENLITWFQFAATSRG